MDWAREEFFSSILWMKEEENVAPSHKFLTFNLQLVEYINMKYINIEIINNTSHETSNNYFFCCREGDKNSYLNILCF